jgi:hypothetical protein
MAEVVIDSGPIVATDSLDHIRKENWNSLMRIRRDYLGVRLPHDCRCLLQFVEDAKRMYKPLGFKNVDDFIEHGLELNLEQVNWAIQGLRQMQPDKPIKYDIAQKLGKQGRPWKSKNKPNKGVNNTFKRGSTNREYHIALLERDGHWRLAEQLRNKEITVKTARKRAGYKITKEPTSFDIIKKLLPKLTKAECKKLQKLLDDLLS